MKKIKDFITKNQLTMELERTLRLPGEERTWDAGANHYNATITSPKGNMTVRYHTGSGWTKDPGLDDVLDCLAGDASTWENDEIDDLELGYKVGKLIEKQSHDLADLLGPDAYNELLWETERL